MRGLSPTRIVGDRTAESIPETDILVTNHSFEADNVANGAYIVGAAGWTFTTVGGVFDRGGPGTL